MKKSIPMRAAGALFIGVMLTASIVSGSFAKYVTQDSSYDEARVAKFGVVASVSGDLFGNSYAAANDNTVQAWSLHNPTVASAVKEDDVVAPGTKSNKNMTIKVTGKPEVSTNLTLENCLDGDKTVYNSDIVLKAGEYGVMVEYTGNYTTDTITDYYVFDAVSKQYKAAVDKDADTTGLKLYQLKDAAKATADYKPLKWKVNDAECADVAAVKLAVDFAKKTADPNEDLSTVYGTKTITWEWPFHVNAETDAKDTILGDMIADEGDNNYQVVVKNGNTYDVVYYREVDAGNDAANKVKIAYTGDSGTLENACAVLTVTFGARLTVTQVD